MNGPRPLTIISGQLGVGGQERSIFLLVQHLDRARFDPDVVSLSEGGHWAARIRDLGVPVLEIPRRHKWEPGRLIHLVRHLRERRPSIVYSLGFAANAYGRTAALLAGVPRRVTGWRNVEATWFRQCIEAFLARGTDRVICNSEAVRTDVLRHYAMPAERVVVIPNGVETAPPPHGEERRALRQSLGIDAGQVLIGSVSRLAPGKNPFLFLEMAAIVKARVSNAQFALVGGGPWESETVARARALGLDPKILLGRRPDGARLSAAFDIFVLTSDREGMPNAVLEAMAAEVPCVVTSVGGSPEVVLDGLTGFVVPRGDDRALADRVCELANQPDLRERFGRRGRARILDRYSVERMTRDHEALFEELR